MATVFTQVLAPQRRNASLAGKGLARLLSWFMGAWQEYRLAQELLRTNYASHPMARRVHPRAWRRHSALFISMYEEGNRPH